MKKLIAIAVVFALAVGTAFAVDLSAEVDAFAKLFAYEGSGSGVTNSGDFDAIRLQGAGEAGEGKFGAKVRVDFTRDSHVLTGTKQVEGQGYAWWKPIDQFKLIIGQSNASDGFWGKEGVTGWGFNQTAYSAHTAMGEGNIWGGGYLGIYVPGTTPGSYVMVPGTGMIYRDAFSAAVDERALGLYMEIKPFDMLGINIGFSNLNATWDKTFFTGKFVFQVDLNLAFGNIALTYKGDNVYMYFNGNFGAIGLDVGLSMHGLTAASDLDSIYFGAGLKYSGGAFNVKFRTAAGIPVKSWATFRALVDVLPYFAINDNISVFVNVGMGMNIKSGLQQLGWHFNPYIRIGAEWGPSFYAGIQVSQKNAKATWSPDKDITFALPIGITVGF